MLKRVSLIIFVFIGLSFLLTGCFDSMEVDDQVYALSVGFDKGVTNRIRLTIQYPIYKKSKGSDDGGQGGAGANVQEGSNVHVIETPTVLEGLDMFGMAVSRRVSLSQAKLFVVSEEIAREGVKAILAASERFRETRTSMNVIVVRGKAEDFIKENRSNIGTSLSKSMELMAMQSENTGFFPFVQFGDFYRGLLTAYGEPVAIYVGTNDFKKLIPQKEEVKSPLLLEKGFLPGELPREGVAKREYVGTAVFDGDKMVGSLNSYETRYYLMVKGQFHRGIISIEDRHSPGLSIPIDVRTGRKPKIKAYFENGKPVIDVNLSMEADISAIPSRFNYEKKSGLEELSHQIQEHIQKGIESTIEKTQKELKSDIFGFGQHVVDNFLTIQEWENYNWLAHYPEAKVNVTAEVNIRRMGLMINSSQIISTTNSKSSREEK